MNEERKFLVYIENDELKYIFEKLIDSHDFEITRNELAEELGYSKRKISVMFREACSILRNKKKELEEAEFNRYVKSCYDKDDILSLDKIAKYHKIESEDLKEIFNDYCDSFTDEESIFADRFAFSEEALKKGNIQTLKYRVRGYSIDLRYADQVFYYNVDKQDRQLLKSVKKIINDYNERNKDSGKVMH